MIDFLEYLDDCICVERKKLSEASHVPDVLLIHSKLDLLIDLKYVYKEVIRYEKKKTSRKVKV